MPSREYATLEKNITSLKRQFLNFSKRMDGQYTNYELTQCRAFITFCHSEVEIYLEAMSLRAVEGAEKHWQQHKRVTNALAAMLAYRIPKEAPIPANPKEQAQKTKFETLVGNAISIQKLKIKGNHGIKPQNLAELFIPIGMKPDQFDETLLIQLKNLGERRGDHVHQNSQISLPKVRDPFDDELNDINFLLTEIKSFDQIAIKIK